MMIRTSNLSLHGSDRWVSNIRDIAARVKLR
jgi:hypothetical protein